MIILLILFCACFKSLKSDKEIEDLTPFYKIMTEELYRGFNKGLEKVGIDDYIINENEDYKEKDDFDDDDYEDYEDDYKDEKEIYYKENLIDDENHANQIPYYFTTCLFFIFLLFL